MKISCILMILLLTACGDDLKRRSTIRAIQAETVSDFSTRLNPSLMVSGVNCDGGETIESSGQTYTCDDDEWLITIDNVNTCDTNGACTAEEVFPFVGTLTLADITSDTADYFNVGGVSPVTADQQSILNQIRVRFNDDRTADVIFR